MIRIYVLKEVGLDRTVLNALRHSNLLREKGKAEDIEVMDGKRLLLTVTKQGAIEEPLIAPLKVSVGARLTHDVMTVQGEPAPHQKNAIKMARLIVGQPERKVRRARATK